MANYQDLHPGIPEEKIRHVLGLSGGKDSAALAVYIRDKYPEIHEKIEYFFTDTGAELPEVYDVLDQLESYLGKPIRRLGTNKDFDYWLTMHDEFLPSAKQRWCTRTMKIKPFESFVGDDPVVSYVGIRADENREGYLSSKDTIKAVFPFVEDGIVRDDVFQMLEDSVGIPEYYKWRSRSGCYFCFFQRQDEWLGLKRYHPELFEKAKAYENRERKKFVWKDGVTDIAGYGYTWSSEGTIDELVAKAEAREKKNGIIAKSDSSSKRWQDVLRNEVSDEDPSDQACLICSL
jgi:3'-phosphoadenosine 5'-phosphosulfate sulfotransferase (PAPS reductase)/FAD synthetase